METPWFDLEDKVRDREAKVRLFCFPYAGAGASLYRPWRNWLPGQVEMIGVQLPGRETRLEEPLVQSMDQLVSELADAISPFLDRPFAFFGYSTGAMICFELARVLRERGLAQPETLILSSQNNPRHKREAIRHSLPDPEFIEVLRECEGTPEVVLQNPVLLELLLPRIRADGAVYETYHYEPQSPLDSRIAVLYGLKDTLVDIVGVTGWEAETQRSFKCYDGFPGGHLFLHDSEERVAEYVNEELEQLLQ